MENPNIDPNKDLEDPNGQPPSDDKGNDPGLGNPPADNPTDFIEVKGVKIPVSEFEALAKEKYKDRFEAYDNREAWQKENTRKAQELKQIQRDAEAFRRLQSDPRFQETFGRPQNTPQSQKAQYVAKKSQQFPDVDPRFFDSQFDDMMELAGAQAKQAINPFVERSSEEWEKSFLAIHPLIKPGTEKYDQLAEFMETNPRVDPEKAYEIVYKDEILNQLVEDRIKTRDEEVKRKLKAKSPSSASGQKPKTMDESFERAWALHGDR